MAERRKVKKGARFAALVLGALVATALAQQKPAEEIPPLLKRVTTRLVLVDVVVTDKQGHPVTGLTANDFVLLEDGKPHPIASFSFEQPAAEPVAAPPPLPQHVHTNRAQYRLPPGPLTILLLDALNTPTGDQVTARRQMIRYLQSQAKFTQHTAVLALTNRLILLQDFTTDPELLEAAIEQYATQPSTVLARADQNTELPSNLSLIPAEALQQLLERLRRLEAEEVAQSTDQRVGATLAALRTMASAVSGYPGRKNVIWVSTGFPFTLFATETENRDLFRTYGREIARTAQALTDAQVAVYPVDARGLAGYAAADASVSGRITLRETARRPVGSARTGAAMTDELDYQSEKLLSTHQTMTQLAEETGGRAMLNRNDIDAAVALSVADGATYYSLAYYPTNKSWNGKFRRIEVRVQREGARARHRRGYYAFDSFPAQESGSRDAEMRAALGGPFPSTALTFLARVAPPAPANQARVRVEFLVDAAGLLFRLGEEGRQQCSVDFLAAAYSPEGKVITSASQTINAALRPDQYTRVLEGGLPYLMEMDLAPGRYLLRLVVRDNQTGLLGSLDVPLILDTP